MKYLIEYLNLLPEIIVCHTKVTDIALCPWFLPFHNSHWVFALFALPIPGIMWKLNVIYKTESAKCTALSQKEDQAHYQAAFLGPVFPQQTDLPLN